MVKNRSGRVRKTLTAVAIVGIAAGVTSLATSKRKASKNKKQKADPPEAWDGLMRGFGK